MKQFWSTAKKEVLLIIHESPGSKFSFIPGDTMRKGSTYHKNEETGKLWKSTNQNKIGHLFSFLLNQRLCTS